MDFSTLPSYPTHREWGVATATRTEQAGHWLSPRAQRNLRDLALLLLIAALYYWLGQMATAIEQPPPPNRQPFDFDVVEARTGMVHMFASRDEVQELLGPRPPINGDWEDDVRHWAGLAERTHRHRLPSGRVWELWTDPNDGDRGIAILFAGGQVYAIHTRGLKPRSR